MSYEIKMYDDDLPIMLTTIGSAIGPADVVRLVGEASRTMDALDRPVYNLVDGREASLDVSRLLESASIVVLGDKPTLSHHNVIQTVLVTTDPVIAAAAKSLRVTGMAHLNIAIYRTLDEAIAYIKAQIAQGSA